MLHAIPMIRIIFYDENKYCDNDYAVFASFNFSSNIFRWLLIFSCEILKMISVWISFLSFLFVFFFCFVVSVELNGQSDF